jgi:hypothetical protein
VCGVWSTSWCPIKETVKGRKEGRKDGWREGRREGGREGGETYWQKPQAMELGLHVVPEESSGVKLVENGADGPGDFAWRGREGGREGGRGGGREGGREGRRE